MKNIKLYFSIILLVSTIYSQNITSNRDLSFGYVATIENLANEGFVISGDRMYTIFPGTNNSGDGASLLSIVDLTTLTVIATYGPVGGYPNKIDVFDQFRTSKNPNNSLQSPISTKETRKLKPRTKRLYKKKSPFLPDKQHIHHLILGKTKKHYLTTGIIMISSLIFTILSLT